MLKQKWELGLPYQIRNLSRKGKTAVFSECWKSSSKNCYVVYIFGFHYGAHIEKFGCIKHGPNFNDTKCKHQDLIDSPTFWLFRSTLKLESIPYALDHYFLKKLFFFLVEILS